MKNFLAVFTGSPNSEAGQKWMALDEATRKEKEKAGMEGWTKWMTDHADSLAVNGGPLGKTKRVGPNGVSDVSNEMSAFVIVKADSHEDAAKMFEGHPHFMLFPGSGVDIMPVMEAPVMPKD